MGVSESLEPTAMIYLWRIASDCPENWIAVHDKESVDPTVFRKALPFEGLQPVRFNIQESQSAVLEQDYLPNSAMLPLVSKACSPTPSSASLHCQAKFAHSAANSRFAALRPAWLSLQVWCRGSI